MKEMFSALSKELEVGIDIVFKLLKNTTSVVLKPYNIENRKLGKCTV